MSILWELVGVDVVSELTCFAHPIGLLCFKNWNSNDNSLHLHSSKQLEIDVDDSLVPQLNICLNLETLIHG